MAATDVFGNPCSGEQDMAFMFGTFLHFFCRSLLHLFDLRAWRTRNLCLRKAILVCLRAAPKSAEHSRSWGAPL